MRKMYQGLEAQPCLEPPPPNHHHAPVFVVHCCPPAIIVVPLAPKVPTPQAQLADMLPSCHAIQFDSVFLFCLTLRYSLPLLFSSSL